MKQLYYTSCKQNEGLQGRPGLQVRAASPGAGEAGLRAAARFCYYFLPLGDEYRPDIVKPEDTPIRFAFMVTPELGPVALHARYYGIDPASGRPGNPFVHLLFDDAERRLDAYNVLKSWQSSFWKSDAADAQKELDEVVELPQDGLDDAILAECAEDEGWLENVTFLLSAFLQLDEPQQILIVGEPPTIVGMLFAIARALPSGLRRKLTFSTYEREIEGGYAKFLGTTWGTVPAGHDLPVHHYQGRGAALNLKSGRRSEGLQDLSYARDVVTHLAAGTLDESIDPFLSLCEDVDLQEPARLEALYQAYQSVEDEQPLGEQNLQTIFSFRPLANQAFRSSTFCGKFVAAVERDPQLAAAFQDPLAAYLSRDTDAAQHLQVRLYAHLVGCVQTGNISDLDSLLKQTVPAIAGCGELPLRLFQDLSDGQTCSISDLEFDVHLYLLELWQAMVHALSDEDRFRRWLLVGSSDELGLLINRLSSRPRQSEALYRNFVRGTVPTGSTLVWLIKEPRMAAALLRNLAKAKPGRLGRAVQILRQAAPNGYLATLLSAADELHPKWVAPLLSTIKDADREAFILKHGNRLLPIVGKSTEFGDMLAALEAADPLRVGRNPELLRFYRRCVEGECLRKGELADRVRAWEFVESVEKSGLRSVDASSVRELINPIRPIIEQKEGHYVLEILFAELGLSYLKEVEKAVFELGPAIITSSDKPDSEEIRYVWKWLAFVATRDKTLAASDSFAEDLMRVRAGVVKHYPRQGRIFLEAPELKEAAAQLFKRLSKKARASLAREKWDWPAEHRTLWDQWDEKHPEGGLLGKGRRLFGRMRNFVREHMGEEEGEEAVKEDQGAQERGRRESEEATSEEGTAK